MTSRERVARTIQFNNPDRVARSFGEPDLAWSRCAAKTHATDWQAKPDGSWERTDEWGNLWRRLEDTSKGEPVRGVMDNLSNIDSYVFPDYSRPGDYECVKQKRQAQPDKWLVGSMPGFTFNVARYMRHLEQYLGDLLVERDAIARLHDRIDIVLADMIRNYAAAGVDAVMFPEDWGTQDRTMISPALWHEEFFPRFKKLCGLAHSGGIKVFMHSCGQIEAIVPGLVNAGIDCLQFDQPTLHGIDILASHQRDAKITFWCPVDIQKTLQSHNEPAIRAEARELLDKLWKGRGGFIAGFYSDEASIGLDPKWQAMACDEFSRHGVASGFRTGV